jgi:transposase
MIPRTYHRVTEEERGRIVVMSESGLSQRAISRELQIHHSTVDWVVNKWTTHHTIQDLPRTGRPLILDDRTKRHLCRMVESHQVVSAAELVQVALRDHQVHISVSTATRMLHEAGLHVRHTIPKSLLTDAHKRNRLEWALRHRDWSVEDWKAVVFSGESIIRARRMNTRELKWIRAGIPLDPRLIVPVVQGGGAKVMVWACISRHGFHDLARLDDRVDAARYIQVLTEHLLPVRRDYFHGQALLFQQDNASVHTARVVGDFFRAQHV